MLTTQSPTPVELSVSSLDIATRLQVINASDRLIVDYNPGTPSSGTGRVKALLPAGKYRVIVKPVVSESVGNFTLAFRKVGASQDSCEEMFVVPGADWDQSIQATDCRTSEIVGDRFRIYIAAGATVTVAVDDRLYSDPALELLDQNNVRVLVGTYATGYEKAFTVTASKSGVYTIAVYTGYQFGPYGLSIR